MYLSDLIERLENACEAVCEDSTVMIHLDNSEKAVSLIRLTNDEDYEITIE